MELYVLSDLESINFMLLSFYFVSMGKKHYLLYQNLASEQFMCSVPKLPYPSNCAKFLQTILN